MTRAEAIKILSNQEMIDVMWDKADEALNMAIDALEQEPIKGIYNKGWKDGAEATAYHVELCEEENPTIPLSVIGDIKAKICEEQECAYADFERYKVEYLGQDWEDVLDSLPQDDFRYGMQRCIEIINKHIAERGTE